MEMMPEVIALGLSAPKARCVVNLGNRDPAYPQAFALSDTCSSEQIAQPNPTTNVRTSCTALATRSSFGELSGYSTEETARYSANRCRSLHEAYANCKIICSTIVESVGWPSFIAGLTCRLLLIKQCGSHPCTQTAISELELSQNAPAPRNRVCSYPEQSGQ
jgi:hypothetical protein